MEIWETNLTGKRICLYFPRWIQQTISMLIKTPLLHQSFGPRDCLSLSLSLSLSLFLTDSLERESWLHNPGNISLFLLAVK